MTDGPSRTLPPYVAGHLEGFVKLAREPINSEAVVLKVITDYVSQLYETAFWRGYRRRMTETARLRFEAGLEPGTFRMKEGEP